MQLPHPGWPGRSAPIPRTRTPGWRPQPGAKHQGIGTAMGFVRPTRFLTHSPRRDIAILVQVAGSSSNVSRIRQSQCRRPKQCTGTHLCPCRSRSAPAERDRHQRLGVGFKDDAPCHPDQRRGYSQRFHGVGVQAAPGQPCAGNQGCCIALSDGKGLVAIGRNGRIGRSHGLTTCQPAGMGCCRPRAERPYTPCSRTPLLP